MSPYRSPLPAPMVPVEVRRARRYGRWSLRHELAAQRACYLVAGLVGYAVFTIFVWAVFSP